MTWARDPKQLSLEALWQEASGGDIMEEASCRRHQQEASGGSIWRRHHRKRHLEVSGRHLGGIWRLWEASWNHLGGIWEASGETREAPGGSRRPPWLQRSLGVKMC